MTRSDNSTDQSAVILGISCDYHDAAAALIIDGSIVSAAEEERFTRVKHDASLPVHATTSCLEIAGLRASDITHVAFYEKPLLVLARYLASRQGMGPSGAISFIHDVPTLVSRNLMIGYRARRMLQRLGHRRPPSVRFIEHHHSHAAAAFHPSPFNDAAILTVDGIGEWATASIAEGVGRRVTTLEELRYPNSLGLLYSFVTAWCGFEPNEGEYKVMGLAPYGVPRFVDALNELVELDERGSFTVDARRLGWYSPTLASKRGLETLFEGPPRTRGAPLHQRDLDLAASVQRFTEDAMLALARRAHERTGRARLCMAGGVALNCVANGRILREGPFAELWIQPAAGDAGSAVGAALALWHQVLERPRTPSAAPAGDAMSWAALGPGIEQDAVVRELHEQGLDHEVVTTHEELVDGVARRLADGAIVGWVQGRMEFGPRALGNRSILADPRDPTVRRRLNEMVKGRESFRPFAPAIMAEHASQWFEISHPSPFMLLVAPVRSEHLLSVDTEPSDLAERAEVLRSTIPACTHVDGSARIQTVTHESNPLFHALLAAFRKQTGCPLLVNTSFNRAGEPIVSSAADAIRSAKIGGLDLLVLGNILIEGTALSDAEVPSMSTS